VCFCGTIPSKFGPCCQRFSLCIILLEDSFGFVILCCQTFFRYYAQTLPTNALSSRSKTGLVYIIAACVKIRLRCIRLSPVHVPVRPVNARAAVSSIHFIPVHKGCSASMPIQSCHSACIPGNTIVIFGHAYFGNMYVSLECCCCCQQRNMCATSSMHTIASHIERNTPFDFLT